jgi:hypothetical protein
VFCHRRFVVGVGGHHGTYDDFVAVEEQTSQRRPIGATAADQLFFFVCIVYLSLVGRKDTAGQRARSGGFRSGR